MKAVSCIEWLCVISDLGDPYDRAGIAHQRITKLEFHAFTGRELLQGVQRFLAHANNHRPLRFRSDALAWARMPLE